MRFELYTQMTTAQCARALAERLEARPSKSRPELDGWYEKSGAFSLALTSKVGRYFSRTTRLSGHIERKDGLTVIHGYVFEGIPPGSMKILYAALLMLVVVLVMVQEPFLALAAIAGGGIAYIPLHGDYVNSDLLLMELERVLKASPTPPKKKK